MAAKKTRKRVSRKQAVDKFCRECIYDPGAEGTWLQQVTLCAAEECPLYVVRPTSSNSKENSK